VWGPQGEGAVRQNINKRFREEFMTLVNASVCLKRLTEVINEELCNLVIYFYGNVPLVYCLKFRVYRDLKI
jgi:hypothetical protein